MLITWLKLSLLKKLSRSKNVRPSLLCNKEMNQLKATKPEELCAHQIHTKYYSYRMINRAKQLKKSKSKYSKMTEYLEFQMLSELEPVQTDFILN